MVSVQGSLVTLRCKLKRAPVTDLYEELRIPKGNRSGEVFMDECKTSIFGALLQKLETEA
jgi:hypothetical protein